MLYLGVFLPSYEMKPSEMDQGLFCLFVLFCFHLCCIDEP